jgi:hypothetical protein
MTKNEYMNEYMKRRWQQRRIRAIMFLGCKCETCGSQEDLQFHHRDPETKCFTLADGSSFSDQKFWNEVLKCELLCRKCHEKLTKALGHNFTKKYRRL